MTVNLVHFMLTGLSRTRFVVRFVFFFVTQAVNINIFCNCYSSCDLLSCGECFLVYLLFFVPIFRFCALCSRLQLCLFAVFMLFAGFQCVITTCLILSQDFYCRRIVLTVLVRQKSNGITVFSVSLRFS